MDKWKEFAIGNIWKEFAIDWILCAFLELQVSVESAGPPMRPRRWLKRIVILRNECCKSGPITRHLHNTGANHASASGLSFPSTLNIAVILKCGDLPLPTVHAQDAEVRDCIDRIGHVRRWASFYF